jgi:hypothetical protein
MRDFFCPVQRDGMLTIWTRVHQIGAKVVPCTHDRLDQSVDGFVFGMELQRGRITASQELFGPIESISFKRAI